MKKMIGLTFVLLATVVGCGGDKNPQAKTATPEQIQQQKENEKQVQAAEAAMQKSRPKERSAGQRVEDEERRRSQGR